MSGIPNWKYFVCHTWNSERTDWEDVLLLPDDPDYTGQAIWITIDGLHEAYASSADPTEREWYERACQLLNGREYWVRTPGQEPLGDTDILVRTPEFSMDELLHWLRVWLTENELPVNELIQRPIQDFASRHSHADLLITLQQAYPAQPHDDTAV